MGGDSLLLLQPTSDVPDGTLMDCGLGTLGLRAEMKHVEKVVMKVGTVRDGKFMDVPADIPEGCPEKVAAVIDGDRAIVLGDGKGCFMTVLSDIKEGAPAL